MTDRDNAVSGVPIVLDDVTKIFPGQDSPAVDHVSLELPAGRTTVFVGPSGCGFPGMAEAYGFDPRSVQVSIMQPGIIYQATSVGRECRFGEVYTTDGRVKGLDLVVLADDKRFFPVYNLATVIRGEVLDAHPEIADVLAPLADVLTNEVMVELNMRVDVDGEDPAQVARDFLVEKGLVSVG